MKKKKRKLKKKVVVLLVLILILILSITGIIIYKNMTPKEHNQTKHKVVNEISGYGYVLEERDPKIYKELFKKLAKELEKEEINYDEYAKLLSQMFAVDFYNLDSKLSKNDVGGTEFVKQENKDNFVLQASDTVYKYIKQNTKGDRKQSLPIVTEVKVDKVEHEKYEYQKIKDDNAYVVTVSIDYKEDLGYPKELTVKLLHTDKKLEIYEMK